MGITLGEGWLPKRPYPEQDAPPASVEMNDTAALLSAIKDALSQFAANTMAPTQLPPVVAAPQPVDLSPVLEALNRPVGLSADDLRAILASIPPAPAAPDTSAQLEVLTGVAEALKTLDFRMRGTGGGGSLSPDITDRASRKLGHVSVDGPVLTTSEAIITESGSTFTEGIRDDIALVFSRDKYTTATALIAAEPAQTGSFSQDTTNGRIVFATGAPANRVVYYSSTKKAVYEPGHTIRGEQTIELSALPTGTAEVRWGYAEDDGAGGILNGIGWGQDANGLFVWRRKNGTDVLLKHQAAFNYDTLTGQPGSTFTVNGAPVAFDPTKNSLFRVEFEWLGIAPPSFFIMAPDGDFVLAHIEETPDTQTGTTLPEPELPLMIRAANDGMGALNVSSGSWRGGIYTSKVVLTGLTPNLDYSDRREGGPVTLTPALTLLGANGVYTSQWISTQGYVSLALEITTDQLSAGNGIALQWSDNASTIRRTVNRTFTASDVTSGSKFLAVPREGAYVRLVYTNGATPQGVFYMELSLNTTAMELSRDTIEATMTAGNTAIMVRNIQAGKSPIDSSYDNVTRTQADSAGRVGEHVGIMHHDVSTPILALTSWTTGQATIASVTVPVQVIPAPTTGRKTFMVKALSSNSKVVYVGPTAGVTVGNGWELAAGEGIVIEVDQTTNCFVIGSTTTAQQVCFAEVI